MVDFPEIGMQQSAPDDYAPLRQRELIEEYKQRISALEERVQELDIRNIQLEGRLKAADIAIVRLAIHLAVTDVEESRPFRRSIHLDD